MNSSVHNSSVHKELWTSWASLLRSYAAAHGLNASQQAVVEVSADTITVRVGARWLQFGPGTFQTSDGANKAFAVREDGSVQIGAEAAEEMDFAAERLMRELLFA